MWFNLYSFPLFYYLNFLSFYLLFKSNSFFLNYKNLNYYFNSFLVVLTLVNLKRSYDFLIINILDTLINFLENLPIIFRFNLKYRNNKYIEICVIKFSLNKNNNSYFKLINEYIIFILPLFLKINIIIDKKKISNIFFINNNINLRIFKFFNKYSFINSNLLNMHLNIKINILSDFYNILLKNKSLKIFNLLLKNIRNVA